MKGSQDRDFVELKSKFIIGILIFGVFAVLLFIILYKKFSFFGLVDKKMKEKEDFVIYISTDNCSDCQTIKNFLDKSSVKYDEVLEKSSEAEDLFKKYDFNTEESISPAVLYFKDGELFANLVNISGTEELELFIKNYKLSISK